MIDKIDVLAHSAVRIAGSKTLYFDPFMIEGEYNDADVIFLTHDHYDHFSPEDFAKVTRENTPVVAPASIVNHLLDEGIAQERIVALKPGDYATVEGLAVEAVASYNIGKQFHPQENEWLGYVVTIDGTRCYVAGDTDINPDVQQVKCDIAMIPVGGTYTTTAEEAAQLINQIRPAIAVPTHYGAITGTKQDGDTFASFVDSEIQVVKKLSY